MKYFRRDKPSKTTTTTTTASPATGSHRTEDQRIAKNSSDDVSALSLNIDNKNRNQIVEHHSTLPISYKQKKRTTIHRKNATLERTTTKKTNEALLLTSSDAAQPKQSAATSEATTKMHYHNSGDVPRYLFGERTKHQQAPSQSHFPKSIKSDEIYLNQSGWVQVHQREFDNNNLPSARYASRDQSFQKYSNAGHSAAKSATNFTKLEALISRNENRKNIDAKLITKVKCAIDPNVSALLSERPGFLPIKRFDDNESPPPITPIISPPPAFQDNNGSDIATAAQQASKKSLTTNGQDAVASNKGMVFSRSFEYDTRKPYEYNQTFSKSFDYDFLSPSKEEKKIEKENNFIHLTGVSPNYLSKKSTSSGPAATPTPPTTMTNARDSTSVYQQYLEPKPFVESVRKSRVRTTFSLHPELATPTEQQQIERSRRGQFTKQESSSSSGGSQQQQQQSTPPHHGFRAMHSAVNKRLNSCDSGARSGMNSLCLFADK